MQSASTPQASRKPKAQATYRARSPPNLAQGPLELGAAPGPRTESVTLTLNGGHEGRPGPPGGPPGPPRPRHVGGRRRLSGLLLTANGGSARSRLVLAIPSLSRYPTVIQSEPSLADSASESASRHLLRGTLLCQSLTPPSRVQS